MHKYNQSTNQRKKHIHKIKNEIKQLNNKDGFILFIELITSGWLLSMPDISRYTIPLLHLP